MSEKQRVSNMGFMQGEVLLDTIGCTDCLYQKYLEDIPQIDTTAEKMFALKDIKSHYSRNANPFEARITRGC